MRSFVRQVVSREAQGVKYCSGALVAGSSLRYELASNGIYHTVYLNGDLHPGSGTFDPEMEVPTSLFAGVNPNNYFYLYNFAGGASGFSADWQTQDGFEEWHALFSAGTIPPEEVPEPATLLLLGSGLLGAPPFVRSRFKK